MQSHLFVNTGQGWDSFTADLDLQLWPKIQFKKEYPWYSFTDLGKIENLVGRQLVVHGYL